MCAFLFTRIFAGASAAYISETEIPVTVYTVQDTGSFSVYTAEGSPIRAICQGEKLWLCVQDLNSATNYDIMVEYGLEVPTVDTDWYDQNNSVKLKYSKLFAKSTTEDGNSSAFRDGDADYVIADIADMVYPIRVSDRCIYAWNNSKELRLPQTSLNAGQLAVLRSTLADILFAAEDLFIRDITYIQFADELICDQHGFTDRFHDNYTTAGYVRTCWNEDDGTWVSITLALSAKSLMLRANIENACVLHHEICHIIQVVENKERSEHEANFEAGLLVYQMEGLSGLKAYVGTYARSNPADDYRTGMEAALEYCEKYENSPLRLVG